ncbi:hypothetical protein BaRGS_00013704 [Batillaria attramentaria]|uniref:SMP domain-containing protein n=1 Tax=Batillaria attramentaria TaxID=370345 RepID=A0ABD0L6T3_9CAEN
MHHNLTSDSSKLRRSNLRACTTPDSEEMLKGAAVTLLASHVATGATAEQKQTGAVSDYVTRGTRGAGDDMKAGNTNTAVITASHSGVGGANTPR